MNDVDDDHPSLEQLKAFDLGHARPAEWAVVERHVAACARCWQTLDSLPDDTLVTLLRESAGKENAAAQGSGAAAVEHSRPAIETQDSLARPGLEIPAELARHPRYCVLALLGVGGMGVVFKAEHLLMNRVVALKVIHKSLIDRPAAVERFRQEVRAAARLGHPNIVTAYDADQAGDVHFLVMEFVEGTSLNRVATQGGPVAIASACEWMRQAAQGLQHAFERGMVHRDFKPQNLLLTPEGQVKILDFGLARLLGDRGAAEPFTPAGAIVGTPDYMAPEQGLDPQGADIRADIYSLGCTLYFLLAGRPPFPAGTLLQKLMAHQDKPPPPLSAIRPDIPPELSRILERLLAKEPAQRYQTPAEVVRELTLFVQAVPDLHRLDPTVAVVPAASRLFRRRRFLAAAAVILAAAGLAGHGLWRQLREGLADLDEHFPDARPGPRGEIRHFSGNAGRFTNVAFSADGRKALTAIPHVGLELWDLDQGIVVGRLAESAPTVLSLAFSPDARRSIFGDKDGVVRVWDLDKGKSRALPKRHTAGVHGVALLEDGDHAVSGGDDGRLVVWDMLRSRPKYELAPHNGRVTCVTLSHRDRFALTGSADNAVRLWDLTSPRRTPFHMYCGHHGRVESAVLASDGRYLLSGGADEAVILWRTQPERLVLRLLGHQGPVLNVALSRDGRRALSGGADGTVRLWDLESGKETARFEGHAGDVVAVSFCADGGRALSGGKDGSLRLWRLPEPEIHGRPLTGHDGPILSGVITPDGKTLATGSADHTIKVWDMATRKERVTLKGHTDAVWSVAISADGGTVVSGSRDKTAKVWDVVSGKVRATYTGHDDQVTCVALTPDEKTVVSGSLDKTVKLWTVATGHARATLNEHSAGVQALALSADGQTLASGSGVLLAEGQVMPGEVLLWDVATGAKRYVLKKNADYVDALAFSPNGKTLAGSQYGTVELWDLATRTTRQTLRGHRFQVKSIAFTADGKTIVTGDADKTVKIWDATSGKLLETLTGHFEAVNFAAVSANGKALASGGEDMTVKVWDLEKPRVPGTVLR